VPQIPNEAHWSNFGIALERGPIDPLSVTIPIVPGFEADESHPVIGPRLRTMRERTERLAAEYAAAGRPAPAPAPADEGKLRRTLAERIKQNVAAQDILSRASAAFARANALYEAASEKISGLEATERANSEAFATEVTRWAGSDDTAAPIHADPGPMNLARIKLADARVELDGCVIARDRLRLDRDEAQRSADNAQQLLFSAAKAVLSSEARAIADEIEQLEQLAGEAFRRLDALAMLPLPISRGAPAMPIQFDAVTTKVALDPPRRGRVDMAPPTRSARDREVTSRWRSYFDRLLVDAAAVLDKVLDPSIRSTGPVY
jgi:hypothetical protein